MFAEILDALKKAVEGAKPWVMIAPWEQGLRVRLGKRVDQLEAGVHLKIPFIDRVFIQSVRARISNLGKQTLSSQRNSQAVVTLTASVEYSIESIETLYRTLHHAEDTICNLVRAGLAASVDTVDPVRASLEEITQRAIANVDLERFGIALHSIQLTEFAIVRTYRLIGDYGTWMHGKALNIEE